MTQSRAWTWRHMIQQSALPPTTKLVLYNLSLHMNEVGESCYPTTAKQAEDTGLSERSVCTHLQKAKDAGFLRVQEHGFGGRKWKRHEYIACWPDAQGVSITETQGTDARSVPQARGTERRSNEALNDVQCNISIKHSINNQADGFDNHQEAFKAIFLPWPSRQQIPTSLADAKEKGLGRERGHPENWCFIGQTIRLRVSELRALEKYLGVKDGYVGLDYREPLTDALRKQDEYLTAKGFDPFAEQWRYVTFHFLRRKFRAGKVAA